MKISNNACRSHPTEQAIAIQTTTHTKLPATITSRPFKTSEKYRKKPSVKDTTSPLLLKRTARPVAMNTASDATLQSHNFVLYLLRAIFVCVFGLTARLSDRAPKEHNME
jgi:hypothetical protein